MVVERGVREMGGGGWVGGGGGGGGGGGWCEVRGGGMGGRGGWWRGCGREREREALESLKVGGGASVLARVGKRGGFLSSGPLDASLPRLQVERPKPDGCC